MYTYVSSCFAISIKHSINKKYILRRKTIVFFISSIINRSHGQNITCTASSRSVVMLNLPNNYDWTPGHTTSSIPDNVTETSNGCLLRFHYVWYRNSDWWPHTCDFTVVTASGWLEPREPGEEAAGEPEWGDPGFEEGAWVGETETAHLRVLLIRSNTGPTSLRSLTHRHLTG